MSNSKDDDAPAGGCPTRLSSSANRHHPPSPTRTSGLSDVYLYSLMGDYLPEPDMSMVDYGIAGSSEHSGAYVAENILVDRPRDQTSRWSGAIAASNTKQWIRLRLNQICVLSGSS